MAVVNETSVCLTAASEQMLYTKVMSRSFCGFPLNKVQVKGAAKKVLMEAYKSHAAKRDLQQQLKVTDEWFLYFTDKFPDVAENLFQGKHGKSCFEAAFSTASQVDRWRSNLLRHVSESLNNPQTEETLKQDPRRVFIATVDNFLFGDRQSKFRYRGMWGVDNFSDIKTKKTDENMACITGFNAAGELAPVLLSIKTSRAPFSMKENFPKDWSLECNSTGWIDTNTLISYANKLTFYLRKHKIKTPVVLVLLTENLYLHIDVTDFCQKNGIILCSLPKHIYNSIVPEDPSENVLARVSSSWRMLESVTRNSFPRSYFDILSNVPESVFANTFKHCSLFPLDGSLDVSRCKAEEEGGLRQLTPSETVLDALEKVLPQRTLLQFQSCFHYRLWLNHAYNTSLFNAWMKLKLKANGTSVVYSDDLYDEEFSDEIPECVQLDMSMESSPALSETAASAALEQSAEPVEAAAIIGIPPAESDVAVALISEAVEDDEHDTIAIALANLAEPNKMCTERSHRGVITSLMQNQSGVAHGSVSMPANPSTPRTTCKIISPDLVEASVEQRVAAGISHRAKVPASVLAALKNSITPSPAKRSKKDLAPS